MLIRHTGYLDKRKIKSTWQLTTSSIAKAVKVWSSKAFAAVQAMMAITEKIAIEKIAIGKNLFLTTSEANQSLKQAKK